MLSITNKMKFLQELSEDYGTDITLGQLMFRYQFRILPPIDQCRFEVIFTFNNTSKNTPGELHTLHGTIKQLLKTPILTQYNSTNIRNNIFELATLFTSCNMNYYGENSDINILLFPIDRELKWNEVINYLIFLANQAAKIEKNKKS